MSHILVMSALLAVLAGCCVPCGHDVVLTEGANASISPDGRRLVFQRDAGDETWIGILDLSSREVEWVEKGPGRSAFPVWTKSGAVVYSHGNQLHTAYDIFKGRGFEEGYGIRRYENGRRCEMLVRGKWRDYSPCVSPDESTLWYCSSRGRGYDGWTGDCESYLARAEYREGAEGKTVYRPPSAEIRLAIFPEGHRSRKACGVSQPVVSPDGKTLVWAELIDFDLPWGLVSAPVDDLSNLRRLTPRTMAAYSPNFSPDGSRLAFTGYRDGDDGWYIYVMEIASGTLRRICRGENPSFVPDGSGLVYDLAGQVHRTDSVDGQVVGNAYSAGRARRSWDEPETLLWSGKNPVAKAPPPRLSDLVFPVGKTFFVRARVKLHQPDAKLRHIVAGKYKECPQGFELYFAIRGRAHFATRNAYGDHEFVAAAEPLSPGEHTIVGIRDGEAIYVSVDGAAPESKRLVAGELPLLRPEGLHMFGRSCGTNTEVLSVDVGSGWPKGVPGPKEVWR